MVSELALQQDFVKPAVDGTPLVVDLDGTLLKSDLLVQSAFAFVAADPQHVLGLFSSMMRGKAQFKATIAASTSIDASGLPYDERVLRVIEAARAVGRPVYLASASNERYVAAVADHLGLFDGWYASTASQNLSSAAKAKRLVSEFGQKGFDYIGNDQADLAVWAAARKCIAIDVSDKVKRDLLALDPSATVMPPTPGGLRAWVKLLRVHQWAKNALVFVPLLTAQRFDLLSIAHAVGAFFAFSFAASAIYILNDLVDLEADRKHPSKRRRPLAAGTVPILQATVMSPLLGLGGLALAVAIAPSFAAVLLIYFLLTTAYTFSLKRKMMVDIVTLAALYTIRVLAGGVAINVPISEWLLAFSMFIFTSLALIKRYVELAARVDHDLPDPSNRNYRKADLDIVAALAAAAGFNSVTVFALYISSDAVKQMYHHPQFLWLACPVLVYWLGRAMMMAHRRLMDDDPIIFALRDRNSLFAFGLIGLAMVLAI